MSPRVLRSSLRQRVIQGSLGFVFAIGTLTLTSCGTGRKPCYPIAGVINVDGKPAAECFIQLHSDDPADHQEGPNRVISVGMTDEAGNYKISTYGNEDGAPAGSYAVTITWRQKSGLLKNQYDGPDRLNGRYADKVQSGLKVTIEAKAQVLQPFELKSK